MLPCIPDVHFHRFRKRSGVIYAQMVVLFKKMQFLFFVFYQFFNSVWIMLYLEPYVKNSLKTPLFDLNTGQNFQRSFIVSLGPHLPLLFELYEFFTGVKTSKFPFLMLVHFGFSQAFKRNLFKIWNEMRVPARIDAFLQEYLWNFQQAFLRNTFYACAVPRAKIKILPSKFAPTAGAMLCLRDLYVMWFYTLARATEI